MDIVTRQNRSAPGSARGPRRGRSGLAALLLAVLAAVVTACGGGATTAPQPAAEAAGTINPSADAVVPSGAAGGSAVPSGAGGPSAPSATSAGQGPATSAVPSAPPSPAPPSGPSESAVSSQAASTGSAPVRLGPPVRGPIMPAAAPVSITVSAISVASPLLVLGKNADGTLEVPPLDEPESRAGWYRNSPEPGTLGPAIILGHIDSARYGPGVFYELGALATGDTVEVTRDDGTVAVFTIDAVRSYKKAEFPTDEVYGNIDHAGIRLITCGGAFDAASRDYDSNIIAFGSLAATRPA